VVPNPVIHFEITGPDGAQIQDFYRSLFDWPIDVQEAMGNYGLVAKGGEGGIGGGIGPSQEGGPPNSLTIYVQVDDLEASLDKVEKLGGKTVVPPTPIPNVGSFAMFSDPAGNTIGLFKG
jgi:predicted enzyme related to lactoylglutathione lyase